MLFTRNNSSADVRSLLARQRELSTPHALNEPAHREWKVSAYPTTRDHAPLLPWGSGYVAFAEFPLSLAACFQSE